MNGINFIQRIFAGSKKQKEVMNMALLQSALGKTKILKSKYPNSNPLQSVIEQLEYLIGIESGKNTDFSKLETINIGIIAVREVEDRDMALAKELYKVSDLVEKIAQNKSGR